VWKSPTALCLVANHVEVNIILLLFLTILLLELVCKSFTRALCHFALVVVSFISLLSRCVISLFDFFFKKHSLSYFAQLFYNKQTTRMYKPQQQQHLALNAVLPGAVQLIQNAQGRVPDLNKAIKNYKPNELFVGNLSYFCEEKDLYALFEENGHVEDVRIIKNDSGTRSLMFGFVTMSTIHETREMEKLLNGQMFMGRKLK
jgi:hypothetical protein